MTNPRPDASGDERPADSVTAPEIPGPPDPADPADPGFERRAFVRRMGSDAVRTAGTMFSLSRILTRSVTAAGQAVIGELESIQVGNAADESVPTAVTTEPLVVATEADAHPEAPAAAAPVVLPPPAAAAPPAAPSPAATLLIEGDQRALLEVASQAVVALNREGHAPQLTTATVLWDGETLRFATLGWSRRTTMLRSDTRIGLLVEGPADGRFVTVTGRGQIVEGRHELVRAAIAPLLLRDAGDGGETAAEAAWQELLAADGDRAVIIVKPEQVLSGRR